MSWKQWRNETEQNRTEDESISNLIELKWAETDPNELRAEWKFRQLAAVVLLTDLGT